MTTLNYVARDQPVTTRPGRDIWNKGKQDSFLIKICGSCVCRKERMGKPTETGGPMPILPACPTYTATNMANSLGRTQWSPDGCLYVDGDSVKCGNSRAV